MIIFSIGIVVLNFLFIPFANAQCSELPLSPELAGTVYIDINKCNEHAIDPQIILWRENDLDNIAKTGSVVTPLAKISSSCVDELGYLSLVVSDGQNNSIALLHNFSVNKPIFDCNNQELGILAFADSKSNESVLFSRRLEIGANNSAYIPELLGSKDQVYFDSKGSFKLALNAVNYTDRCVSKRWHVSQNVSTDINALAPILALAIREMSYSRRCTSIGYLAGLDNLKGDFDSADFDESLKSRAIFICSNFFALVAIESGIIRFIYALDHNRINKQKIGLLSVFISSLTVALAAGYTMGPVTKLPGCGCFIGPLQSERDDIARCPAAYMQKNCQSFGYIWANVIPGLHVPALVLSSLGLIISTMLLTCISAA